MWLWERGPHPEAAHKERHKWNRRSMHIWVTFKQNCVYSKSIVRRRWVREEAYGFKRISCIKEEAYGFKRISCMANQSCAEEGVAKEQTESWVGYTTNLSCADTGEWKNKNFPGSYRQGAQQTNRVQIRRKREG